MPLLLSVRAARLAASACRDAGCDLEKRAQRMQRGHSGTLEMEARAKEYFALAAQFEEHASKPQQQRRLLGR